MSATITAIADQHPVAAQEVQPSRSWRTYGVPASAARRPAPARMVRGRPGEARPPHAEAETASTISALAAPTHGDQAAGERPRRATPTVRSTVPSAGRSTRSRGTLGAAATSAGHERVLGRVAGPAQRHRPTATSTQQHRERQLARRGAAAGSRRPRPRLSRSQPIATRRAPTRSMSGPPSTLSTTSGSSLGERDQAGLRRPIPVVVSTSHGSAIIETRVPASEIASASQPADEGRRRLTRPRHPGPDVAGEGERRGAGRRSPGVGVVVRRPRRSVLHRVHELLDDGARRRGCRLTTQSLYVVGLAPRARAAADSSSTAALQLLGIHDRDRLQVGVEGRPGPRAPSGRRCRWSSTWCAAFHQRSRPLPRSASSTTKPCWASWRRWYDVAPVLRPSRAASVVAVAGPSMRSIPSIRSRTGWVSACSSCGVGVIEVRSMPPPYDCKRLFAIISLQRCF